jgi:hypothetical protein
MAETKITYGTSTALTFTALQSLASSATAGAESLAVDNSSTLFVDAMVTVTLAVPNSGSVGNDLCAYVYAYGSEDGSNYDDDATVDGSDKAVTPKAESYLKLLGTVAIPAINYTYNKTFGSVALVFGGTLPRKWGIYIRNYSGAALNSSGNVVSFTGITYTTA